MVIQWVELRVETHGYGRLGALSYCRPIIFGSFSSPSNGVASPISAFIDGIEDEGPFYKNDFYFLPKQLGEKVGNCTFLHSVDARCRPQG